MGNAAGRRFAAVFFLALLLMLWHVYVGGGINKIGDDDQDDFMRWRHVNVLMRSGGGGGVVGVGGLLVA